MAGGVRATLMEAAVGPQAGEARIHVSARDDSSSLLPITARQSALFPGTATIRVLRLVDALPAAEIAAPALLKLDVQGFEMLGFSEPLPKDGGKKTLSQSQKGPGSKIREGARRF